MPRALFLAVGLCLAAPSGPSHAQRLPLRAYGASEGLAGDHVRFVMQDSRGFLWLATNAGVSRFDGQEFRNYGLSDGLPVPGAWKVLESADGSLCVLSAQQVVRGDISPGSGPPVFRPVRPAGLDEQVGDVFALDLAPGGGLLLAGSRGAARVAADENGTERLEPIDLGPPHGPDLPDAAHVWAAAYDRDGALWAARTYGITRVGPDGVARTLPLARERQVSSGWGWLPSLTVDRGGDVWLLTVGSGTWHLAADTGGHPLVSEVLDPAGGVPSSYPRGLHRDRDGTVWLGTTDHGLVACDGPAGARRCRAYGRPHGLPESDLYGVTTDAQGNLWAGTLVSGIVRLSAEGLTSWGAAEGLGDPPAVYALGDETGGDLLITLEGLRFALLSGGRIARTWSIRREIRSSWGSQQLLARGRDGRLWVATGIGLAVYPHGTGAGELASLRPERILGTADGLPGTLIHRLFAAGDGSMWFGVMDVSRGVCRVGGDGTGLRCYGPEDGLPTEATANAFGEDAAGGIWFGLYGGGVYRARGERVESWAGALPVPWRHARSIQPDGSGRLWIAGNPALVRVDRPESDRPSFHVYGPGEGLPMFDAHAVALDALGRVCLGGVHGVECLDPTSGAVRRFTTADGLPSNRISTLHRDPSGVLWIGTSHGVARLEPRARGGSAPPRVYLTGLNVAGSARDPAGPLALASDERTVEFAFTAPSFRPGETMRFQWRLVGASEEWSPPGSSRAIALAGLSPGRYRFEVRAVDGEGLVSEPATAAFSIRPPLWRQGWVLALAVLAMATVVAALYRARVARLLEVERVRTRIATDLHDDIGASLSQIAVLSQYASRQATRGAEEARGSLQRITDLSGAVVDGMSDVVWSINPARDRMSDLVHRMRRFAVDLFSETEVALTLEFPEEGVDEPLDPEVRREVFLVFKEALRNAARHARASSVEVSLRREAGGLALAVRDDGRGIAPGAAGGEGFGLGNMTRRAAGVGGSLEVRPRPGGGTEVVLVIPGARRRRWLSTWTGPRSGRTP